MIALPEAKTEPIQAALVDIDQALMVLPKYPLSPEEIAMSDPMRYTIAQIQQMKHGLPTVSFDEWKERAG